MYAVIKTGGKQQKVTPGEVIEVEYMSVDPGSAVEFEPILVVDDDGKAHVGKGLSRARVVATLLGDKKADKIKVFKYRPKSGYKRTQGHRQTMTILEVQEIALGDQVARKPEPAEEPAEKPAGKKAAGEKKGAAKKGAAKKEATKKPAAKKPAAKKSASKKTASKKSASKETGSAEDE
jgi:large subunit ribosomal protein L21